MTPAAIRKLVKDSIAEALVTERAAVAAAAENARPADVAATEGSGVRKCTWKDFKNGDPIKFKGTEGATAMIRWFEHTESVFYLCNCPEESKVKFAASTLLDEAMSWWNSYTKPMGKENAYKLTWDEFKKLLTKKFCPRTEVKKLEMEFYELVTAGNDIEAYIRRFQELAVLCPTLVPDNEKLLENFIGGLPPNIRGDVLAFDPQTMDEAIRISQKLMAQIIKEETIVNNNNIDNKRKMDDNQGDDQVWQPNKGQEVVRAYAAGPRTKKRYTGNLPYCNTCNLHHLGHCSEPCGVCKKRGHPTKDCKKPTNQRSPGSCFKCGNLGHLRKDCPELKNKKTKA